MVHGQKMTYLCQKRPGLARVYFLHDSAKTSPPISQFWKHASWNISYKAECAVVARQ